MRGKRIHDPNENIVTPNGSIVPVGKIVEVRKLKGKELSSNPLNFEGLEIKDSNEDEDNYHDSPENEI